jgi:hypothetical protein
MLDEAQMRYIICFLAILTASFLSRFTAFILIRYTKIKKEA